MKRAVLAVGEWAVFHLLDSLSVLRDQYLALHCQPFSDGCERMGPLLRPVLASVVSPTLC